MKYKDLTEKDRALIMAKYNSNEPRLEIQNELADLFDVAPRTIRKWAHSLETGLSKENIVNPAKILVYDIETSRAEGKMWWTGKQYIHYKQIKKAPSIISISWKWLGENKVHSAHWDMETHSDEEMLEKFLSFYNEADMVVGQNNNNFDNRWVNARAAKYNMDVNTYIRSYDIMKRTKKHFRLLSYSMDYLCEFFELPRKLQHAGTVMWDMIEDGTPEEQEYWMKEMLKYNEGDIISTEAMYLRLRKYLGHNTHFGVLTGKEKFSCPECGGSNIKLFKSQTVTAAGTIQHVMQCQDDKILFKISNRDYLKWLENK